MSNRVITVIILVALLLGGLAWYLWPGPRWGAAPADGSSPARVGVDALVLRAGPSRTAAALYLLPRDWPVVVTEFRSDVEGSAWAYVSVETPQGQQAGWVYFSYLIMSPLAAEPEATAPTAARAITREELEQWRREHPDGFDRFDPATGKARRWRDGRWVEYSAPVKRSSNE